MANTDFTATMPDQKFFVVANKNASAINGWNILEGDNLLIDPNDTPSEGDMVLVGNMLVAWDGQDYIRGVLVQAGRRIK